jgi:quercetin dioxygenase-like cupin family protein
MYRLLPFFLVASLCAAVAMAQQAAVSIDNEPHHTRLLYTNDLRLWEVTLAPGQSTPPFVHQYDVATVVIGDGTLSIQRNGEAVASSPPNARGSVIVAEHTGARPTAYRIENSGTTDYRAFEIENMHEAKQSPPFAISDVTLKRGDAPAMHQHMGATIIVLINGALEQGGIGGPGAVRIQEPGQWLSLPRFQAHTIQAVGSGDARAVEIEVR